MPGRAPSDAETTIGINITVLEPGQFRTDFFNKGKTQIKESNKPDYKPLVDSLNQQFTSVNGRQNGSPELAAMAIIELSKDPVPPLRVPLGADAVSWTTDRLKLAGEELALWKQWAINTAFDEAASLVIRPGEIHATLKKGK
jgi:hypothetical protein